MESSRGKAATQDGGWQRGASTLLGHTSCKAAGYPAHSVQPLFQLVDPSACRDSEGLSRSE